MMEFEYLVQPKAKQRIPFGTTQVRDVSALSSKFNRLAAKYQPEVYPNLSPCSYFVDKGKTKSEIKGNGSLVPRFKRIVKDGPTPGSYDIQSFCKPVSKAQAPFNSKTSRDVPSRKSSVPGVGTYNMKDDFIHHLNYYQNFGKRRIKVTAPHKIEDLHNRCGLCGSMTIDCGEAFWVKVSQDPDSADVICCACMKDLQRDAFDNLKKLSFLRKYKLKCECPYYHWHAGLPNHRVLDSTLKVHNLPKEAQFYQHLHIVKEEEKDESVEGFTREVFDVIYEDIISGVPADELQAPKAPMGIRNGELDYCST